MFTPIQLQRDWSVSFTLKIGIGNDFIWIVIWTLTIFWSMPHSNYCDNLSLNAISISCNLYGFQLKCDHNYGIRTFYMTSS